MKILYLTVKYPALSETFVSDQVEFGRSLGINVEVMSVYGPDTQIASDLRHDCAHRPGESKARLAGYFVRGMASLCRRPRAWRPSLRIALTLRHRIAFPLILAGMASQGRRDWDVMVCHFGEVGLWGRLINLALGTEIPQVTVFHGYDLSAMVRRRGIKLYHELFRSPKHESVVISGTWLPVMSILGDPQAKLLRLGVDLKKFGFAPRKPPRDRPLRLITTARLVKKKGHATVLHALSRITHASWEYHVIGDGPEARRLQRMAEDLGIANRVSFLGARSHEQVRELTQRADVFVLASQTAPDGDMEGIPVVLMEAMAAGIPVISTIHSGIADLIENGRNGLIVAEGDIAALAKAIDEIAESKSWSEMITLARQRIEDNYDLARNSQAFFTFVGCARRTSSFS